MPNPSSGEEEKVYLLQSTSLSVSNSTFSVESKNIVFIASDKSEVENLLIKKLFRINYKIQLMQFPYSNFII